MSALTQAVHEQQVNTYFKTTKSAAQSGKAITNGTSGSPTTNKSTTPSKPSSATKSKKPKQTNKEVQYDNISTVTDSPAVPVQDGVETTNGFQISFSSNNVNHAEFTDVPDSVDAPDHLSIRKTQGDESQEVVSTGLDQRQRGKAAADSLNSLIRGIFSAVGKTLGMEEGQEHIATMLSDKDVTLTAATQHKLHGAIQKAIDFKTFDQVSVENLLQILKLAEASLNYLDGVELDVQESWDDDAVGAWIHQLSVVDRALKSSRTCLRIMSGGRPEKQLYSESIINSSIELVESMSQNIITPLVELRPSGSGGDLFRLLAKHKKTLSATFLSCQKLAALLAEIITKIDLSEQAISKLENTASKLIFVENAHVERESLLGVQKFDGIRSVAMDVLSQVFLANPDQRQSIFDDILSSLEKLPVGKLSSRQFKLSDGGSVQPVSALIMRLVQASSGYVDKAQQSRRATLLQNLEDDGDAEGEPEMQQPANGSHPFSSITGEDHAAQEHKIATQELSACSYPLIDTATRNASYVINYIVSRALRSTKSGDAPYRNLLDLFVEDFTTCLDSPDWPSAEMLLRLLMLVMVQQVEGAKTAAPAKNMALELLGTMSAAISRLRSHAKRTATSLDSMEADDMSQYLASLALNVLEQTSSPEQLVEWSGPFRAVLESIQARSKEDPHLSSAVSFIVSDWACRAVAIYEDLTAQDEAREASMGTLSYRLTKMIQDRQWLSNQFSFKVVSSAQAKMAYSIVLLRSPLCESFPKILNILLSSMGSDQATVRSKSLKSVSQVLETDPSILDGESTVIDLILVCAKDPSIQVRDSALGLLGSCVTMRPALEPKMTPTILDRFSDAGIGVRKRAMKLARDIYLRNNNRSMRTAIANGLLKRIQDPEEGVRDLARQIMEEVWFVPFYRDDGSAAFKTSMSEHVSLVIQTVKTGPGAEVLDNVFQTILRPNNKFQERPFAVCSRLVNDMFGLLNNPESEDGSAPSGKDALQVLTIFAKADPKLFNNDQIRLLKPQLSSFTGDDELAAFRAVTIIYRRVLPELSTINHNFLLEVRQQMNKTVNKISSRFALDDLIACLQTICDLLNDLTPLANIASTGLVFIESRRGVVNDKMTLLKFQLYSILIGMIAKHCDLDQKIDIFRAKMPSWKGKSVPRLIVDILAPYTSPDQGLEARKASLEAIGLTCQSWPRNYELAKVYTSFQQVFTERNAALEERILRSFKEFLMGEERRSEQASLDGSNSEQKPELAVMGGTSYDDVASGTTQRFLGEITRIALASQGEHAVLATEVLGSINRQGLTHPKEIGITLITLETSQNRRIAELAWQEHRTLHEKHETVIEREYAKAVQAAFNYQRDVENDVHGATATADSFQSKLHYMVEVLKISKPKSRQRFFEKICMQVDFDPSSLKTYQNPPEHLSYSRFLAENLAYFEYLTVGELQGAVAKMEKIVTTTGASLAQTIEMDILDVRMDAEGEDVDAPGELTVDEMGLPIAVPAPPIGAGVNPQLLRRLATGSIILSMLWETRTYLRRLYGMGTSRFDAKAKALAKDANKAPIKVQGIQGDKFWEELETLSKGLDSEAQMGAACKAFVELLNFDKELKVADEDELGGEDPSTPSEGEDKDELADRGRKRKGGSTPGGRKKRQRSSSQSNKRGRPRKSEEDSDDDFIDDTWA